MDGILSQQLFPLESFLGGPRAKRYTWTYVYNPYKWPKNKWVCLELFHPQYMELWAPTSNWEGPKAHLGNAFP